MKRIASSIIMASILLIGVSSPVVAAEKSLTERVKGHILLQVQNHGEAWYVSPLDGARYYMKDGPTAYEMMRYFGLGMTEADFAKLETGNEELISRLLGRIVLRVQAHGEAYYVHPDGTIHYLQNGEAAYQVMRSVSLGITNTDLEKVMDKEMPAEVRARLPVPESAPSIPVSDSTPPIAGLSQDEIDQFTSDLARKIVEEQEKARLAQEAKDAAAKAQAAEDAMQAAKLAEDTILARMAEAKRVRLAIQSEIQKLRSSQEYLGWMDSFEENRKAIETLNKCGQQNVDLTQTVQNFCDQEMQKAGVTLTEVRVSLQKYGEVQTMDSTTSSIDKLCYDGGTVHERLTDRATCDTWMNHYKFYVNLRWEAREKMSKAVQPLEELSIMWGQAFSQTEQNGAAMVGGDDMKKLLHTKLGAIGISSYLVE